ncbi:MAG: hypothetical protein KBB11_00235 [Bacteroidales bacterium]|nr:hypothetical protein [Bacteroidales bacterium]HOY38894.1 hypothetical protein [Bacteroidales bacterium]HQP04275.1 hypothetical protein [Bacteroidales bacterium]
MKYFVVLIIAFSASLVFLSGCAKVEQDVIGEWKSELMKDNPTAEVTWEFKTDGTLVRTYIDNPSNTTEVDECFYSVEKKLTKTLIKIDGSINVSEYENLNGIWQVEYFNDNMMKLRRIDKVLDTKDREDGSYLYREFTRVN